MSWEQRLREMVLAGGALAAVGCAGGSSAGTPGPDGAFCCNGNGDPCCPSNYCGAAVTPQCTEKMACEADGGTWDYYYPPGCARDAGPSDATSDSQETGPSDAAVDGNGSHD
jgi:hypothetical protein